MLRDFEIPISISRAARLEDLRQKARLANDAIGGLWFLDNVDDYDD
jgi:hypothetical protein